MYLHISCTCTCKYKWFNCMHVFGPRSTCACMCICFSFPSPSLFHHQVESLGRREVVKDTVVVNGVRHSLDLVALICYFKLKKKCQGLCVVQGNVQVLLVHVHVCTATLSRWSQFCEATEWTSVPGVSVWTRMMHVPSQSMNPCKLWLSRSMWYDVTNKNSTWAHPLMANGNTLMYRQ